MAVNCHRCGEAHVVDGEPWNPSRWAAEVLTRAVTECSWTLHAHEKPVIAPLISFLSFAMLSPIEREADTNLVMPGVVAVVVVHAYQGAACERGVSIKLRSSLPLVDVQRIFAASGLAQLVGGAVPKPCDGYLSVSGLPEGL